MSSTQSYIRPICNRNYYNSSFTDDNPNQSCSIIINGHQCNAPRWCHPVYNPEIILKNSNNSNDFIHRYCKLTQKQIKKKNPIDYKTFNELCIECLNRRICCLYIDHLEDKDNKRKLNEINELYNIKYIKI